MKTTTTLIERFFRWLFKDELAATEIRIAQLDLMVNEKSLYYLLEDTTGQSMYFETIPEITETISLDLCDIVPFERDKVKYRITPVYLTEIEFKQLPQFK